MAPMYENNFNLLSILLKYPLDANKCYIIIFINFCVIYKVLIVLMFHI